MYCVFAKGNEETPAEEEGKVKSLVDSATQMIAKVDSRSKTERDQVIELGIDIMHSHLFDKESELTILEGEGTKAYVPVVELERRAQRAEEEAAKAAEKEAKAAEKAAKAAEKAAAKKKAKEEPAEAAEETKTEE